MKLRIHKQTLENKENPFSVHTINYIIIQITNYFLFIIMYTLFESVAKSSDTLSMTL